MWWLIPLELCFDHGNMNIQREETGEVYPRLLTKGGNKLLMPYSSAYRSFCELASGDYEVLHYLTLAPVLKYPCMLKPV